MELAYASIQRVGTVLKDTISEDCKPDPASEDHLQWVGDPSRKFSVKNVWKSIHPMCLGSRLEEFPPTQFSSTCLV